MEVMYFDPYLELKTEDEDVKLYAWMQGPIDLRDKDEQSEISEEDELMSYTLTKVDSSLSLGV